MECLHCFDGETDRSRPARRAGPDHGRPGGRATSKRAWSRRSAPAASWKTRHSERMEKRRQREFAEAPRRDARARGLGLSGRNRAAARNHARVHGRHGRRSRRGRWPCWASPRRTSARPAAGNRISRPMACMGPATRPHLHRAGHVALRRAGALRPDAQAVRHADRRKPDGYRRWSIGWPTRAGARCTWRTTATPSSTPSNSRCCSCNTSTGPDIRVVPILCGPYAQQHLSGRRAGKGR